MSTRSMTVIRSEGHDINLYRHCDGYPAEAGASLLEAIGADATGMTARQPGRVVELLVQMAVAGETAPHYEPAFYGPRGQGDLEHVYIAEHAIGGWHITHHERGEWGSPSGGDDFTSWPRRTHTIAEFAEVVNKGRREMNARLAELRKEHSQQDWGADYPMVTA